MRWDNIDNELCAIARTLSVVGDRWTLLVIRDCFLGSRRFDEFQKGIGLSRHRLADRLNKLVENKVLEKVLYQEKPPRYEYLLTERGKQLQPLLLVLATWGNQWMTDKDGALLEYEHRTCEHKTIPVLSCGECGDPIKPGEIKTLLGPGILKKLAQGETAENVPPGLAKKYQKKF